ncbi:MAG: DEAD/DEAH box helicase, partial [Gammaproteobacteria bacterium]|nr:DEAD/DEAH box helicase [Gammaproteobacteria bacterium]
MNAPTRPESPAEPADASLSFAELDLVPGVKSGIDSAGFVQCTPIQAQSLPLALTGRDVAGQAQTGTGKTAAYLIALYQYLETHSPLKSDKQGPRALILAPTRELAVQIHKDAMSLGTGLKYRLGLAFGGTDYDKQRDELAAGIDVLIGTPGRTIDFFKQGVFALKTVQVLVLDEADRMFDLGFIRDIRYVLRRLPPHDQRLNLLFSATLSHRVLELAYEHMNDPELVRVEPDKRTADKVTQSIYFPANDEKVPLLIMLLRAMDARRTMVFVNTKREAEHLCDQLTANGIQAAAISGDVPQRKRLKMFGDFLAGSLPVLIGTDVASRGLHVPDVSHVFNYDLPQDPEDYVHRIGRTARAGASGDAISFGCENYAISLPDIEDYIGHKIPVAEIDRAALDEIKSALEVAMPRPLKRRGSHGDGGGRGRGGKGHGKGRSG